MLCQKHIKCAKNYEKRRQNRFGYPNVHVQTLNEDKGKFIQNYKLKNKNKYKNSGWTLFIAVALFAQRKTANGKRRATKKLRNSAECWLQHCHTIYLCCLPCNVYG